MKKLINIFLVGTALAASVVSCTDGFEEMNRDPYLPTDLSPDDYALTSSMMNIFGSVVSNDVNRTQFLECLLGGTQGGYYADGSAGFTNSIARYNAPNGWTRVFMEAGSKSLIPTLYTNLSMVNDYCEEYDAHVPNAIGLIVKVAAMSRVTDCYGPIPYSKIGYDGSIVTPYDSQEDIYNKFFEELEEARNIIAAYPEESLNSLIDEVYHGDMQKWVKFANSLQLRLALRISYANPTLAKEMAEAAVNPANGGLIEDNADNAMWDHFNTNTNSMLIAIQYNDHDSRAAADIICYMNGYNDPRRAKYFYQSEWKDSDGKFLTDPEEKPLIYVGTRRGWAVYNAKQWGIKFCDINLDSHAPFQWLNAAEVAFNRAEGAAVFGWDMGGTAEQFYNKGIALSFEQYNVAGAEEYAADDTSVPAGYYDPSNFNPWNGTLPAVTIKWDESATKEQKQERIAIQKWIANWTIGNESWAEIRRTGYPKLIPVAYNGSAGIVDSEKGAQRMPYPQEEYTNNGANVQAAVTNYLGGPDNMGTKVWWACKPGL